MNENIVSVQQVVQRKLGRCILRLQQVEQLLKAIVPHISMQGNREEFLSIKEKQIVAARKKTLGGLVSSLTGELLAPATKEETIVDEPENVDSTGWISIDYQIRMSDEEFEKTKQALVDFVEMRNGLVHHFIDRFKISKIAECHKAAAYLDECDEKISAQLLKLQQWGMAIDKARAAQLAYFGSAEFENYFVHGVMPDRKVQSERSTIVEYLRNAEKACAQDGWALLDTAIIHVSLSDKEQTPSKYGCKTWREVLKKSGQFETKKDVNPGNGKGQFWYRSLTI
jgi:hypothetical protein